MPQQLVLQPLGIVTEPNKLGQVPAGALMSAYEAVERAPGYIENTRAWTKWYQASASVDYPVYVVPLPGTYSLVIGYNDTFASFGYLWLRNSDAAVVYNGAMGDYGGGKLAVATDPFGIPYTTPSWWSHEVVNGRLFLNNGGTYVYVFDTLEPTTADAAKPRRAGITPPRIGDISVISGEGTALAQNTYALYTVVLKRRVGNHLIVTEPWAAVPGTAYTASTAADMQLTVVLPYNQFIAGDTVEVYRTESKPNGATTNYQSFQAGEETGSEYRRATSRVLTAADITAGQVLITDTTKDADRGEALYTNAGVDGAGAGAERPPMMQWLVAYKGYLFGFYPTYPARVKLRAVGPWGGFDAAQPAAHVKNGFGRHSLSAGPYTWTAGNATVNGFTSTETSKFTVGQQISVTGGFGSSAVRYISAIGSTSVTITPTPTNSGSVTFISIYDWFEFGSNGSLTGAFNFGYIEFVTTLAYNSFVEAYGLGMKLAPYTMPLYTGQTLVQPVDGIELRMGRIDATLYPLQVRSDKSDRWDPQVGTWNGSPTEYAPERFPHKLTWSNLNEPEAWPQVNFDYFSTGEPIAAVTTKDAIVASYTDGFWLITGTGGAPNRGYDWRYDQIARDLTLRSPQCITTQNDKVYAWTNDGLVRFSGSTVENLSKGRIHDQLDTPPYSATTAGFYNPSFVRADSENNEVVFSDNTGTTKTLWSYNIDTDRFMKSSPFSSKIFMTAYSPYHRKMMVCGRDADGSWSIKMQTGAYTPAYLDFQPVYADNPFGLRRWQSIEVSADVTSGGSATITALINGVSAGTRTLDASGRTGFEIPRNAGAFSNTVQVSLIVTSSVKVKLHGFAIKYNDHTDRRRVR